MSQRLWIVLLAALSATCQSSGPLVPDTTACALGALPLSPSALAACAVPGSGCPLLRPEGAKTLVSLATCDYQTGEAPCTTRVTTCPLVNPSGNVALPFQVGPSACADVVFVLPQASGDGGAGVEWRVQERALVGGACVASAPERVGVANVSGACCSTTVDVPLAGKGRTLRLMVQTDWRR